MVFLFLAKLMIAAMIICVTGKWALNQRSTRHCYVRKRGIVGGDF